MQVERSPQGDSGKRVSNAWVTYPEAWDNPTKDGLIPHVLLGAHAPKRKDGEPARVLSFEEGPASHQLVGRVTAYQGV